MDNDAIQYALRRKDTGEYFWTPKKNPYKKLKAGDPKTQNWTGDLNKAKLYSLSGIRVLASQERIWREPLSWAEYKEDKECQSWAEYVSSKRTGFDVEIVKFNLVIEEVIGVEKK